MVATLSPGSRNCAARQRESQIILDLADKSMDVLLKELSISAKGELTSLCCMMGKAMSLRCYFLAVNGWRLID